MHLPAPGDHPARRPTARRRAAGTALALLAVGLAGCTNAPAPGEQLERDGESPVISDPGGVANDLTDQQDDVIDEILDDSQG